jgi:hypothetical protein
MRALWCGALFVGAVLVIAGCRGGASNSLPDASLPGNPTAATRNALANTAGTGTLVVALPGVVAAAAQPTPGAVGTYLLSAGTRSISGAFGKTTFGPINIAAGSSNCVAINGGGRNCTIQVPVQAGTNYLTLQTAGSNSSFGRLAFVGKTLVKIRPGVLNYVKPLKWFGVATGVTIISSRKTVTQFQAASVILTVYGLDGSGAKIPEINLIGASGGGFTTTTTATGPYNQSLSVKIFTPTVWTYDGRYTGKETFLTTGTVKKAVVATSSVNLKLAPANASTKGQVLAASQTYQGSPTSIIEFTVAGVGNVPPLRTLSKGGIPYGATANGNFWVGPQQFDNIGNVLGTIQPQNRLVATAYTVDSQQNEYVGYRPSSGFTCTGKLNILVFAANSFGATTTRNLSGPASCPASVLAVDGTGVLYAYIAPSYSGKMTGTVLEFAPNTSGNVPPSLTISNVFLQNIVGDAAGNLYAIQNTSSAAGPGTLVKFAAGSMTPTTVLPAVSVGAFALDSQGNIYAEVPTSSTAFQIEEFPAGSTTPSRIIGGSSTMLAIPAGITVLP